MATSLIQLLCRMTKLGWFEDDGYRALADEARNFLERGTSVRPAPLGVPLTSKLAFLGLPRLPPGRAFASAPPLPPRLAAWLPVSRCSTAAAAAADGSARVRRCMAPCRGGSQVHCFFGLRCAF